MTWTVGHSKHFNQIYKWTVPSLGSKYFYRIAKYNPYKIWCRLVGQWISGNWCASILFI